MGIRDRWHELFGREAHDLEPARRLDLSTGFNVRELGGYALDGGETRHRAFLRSGGLDMLSADDQRRLHAYGVRMVVDLRGDHEVSCSPDRLACMPGVRFLHVPLFGMDLSDPALGPEDPSKGYWTLGYLTMLANHDAMRRIFEFFSTAGPDECVLFHCAAGMDRTGVVAMLLLLLCGASRERVVADYCYSFASEAEVDGIVFGGRRPQRRELELRLEAANTVLDRLGAGYGTAWDFLRSCDVSDRRLCRVRDHILR